MRTFDSRALIVAALLGVPGVASGQASLERQPGWSFTIDVGGFVQGNRRAVTNWLTRNAYGAPEPQHCGFDIFFRRRCDDAVAYPQVSGSGIVAGVVSLRRTFSRRWAVELFAANEQSGIATGRCDDVAVPKDTRCTTRFREVSFGGGSFALLAVASRGHVHLGAGPALLLANWQMQPAHLSGIWVDASIDREAWPLVARAQYRIYRSASFAPEQGFVGFHPSTLFVGLGFVVRPNNVGM